jgi:hypothetical protein
LKIAVFSLSAIASSLSLRESFNPGFSMYYLIVFWNRPI